MKNNYLIRTRLNKINDQLSILKTSPAIVKNKWISENQLKLDKLKTTQSVKLNQLRKTFDETYFITEKEEKIKKLDDKVYWKSREYKQSLTRQLKRVSKSADSDNKAVIHQKKYEEKLTKLQDWRKLQEESINLNIVNVEQLDKSVKATAKTEYDRLKVEFDREFQIMETSLKNKTEERLNSYLKTNQNKILKIDKQLTKIQNELQSNLNLEKENNLKLLNELNNKPSLTENETIKKNTLTALEELQSNRDILLRLQDLSMKFGGLKAVDHLSFDVKKGEIFGLIGPNGAGKTTVFNCITQFYKASEGQIFYRDNFNEIIDLQNIMVHNVIKEGIVRTFQNVELIWELSVLDNLLVGAHSRYRSNFFVQLLHLPKLKREEEIYRYKATEILKMLNLLPYKDFPAYGLPYGILKRIELARTLMTDPKLIILDEPAAGLNDLESVELAKTIRLIRDKYQCTIFLVEHDMGLVMDICDRICAISFGKKLAIGTPKEIQQSKIVQESYLGGE